MVAIFSNAGAQVVVQTRGIAHPLKSRPVPLFAQKPLKLYSQIIFIGRIAFLLQSFLNDVSSSSVSIVRGGSHVDRSQPRFYFVPQEKGLIRRTLWAWKSMGKSIFHSVTNQILAKIPQNRWVHMPRSRLNLSDLFYVHFPGRGSHFSKGDQ